MTKSRKKINRLIRQFYVVLPLCFAILLIQSAFCYTLKADELNKIIFNKINSQTKKELGQTEYKINIQGPIYDVSTKEENAPKVEISPLNNFNPVSYRRVTIKDSKGNLVKTIPINIHILIYENVLMATDTITYGKNIDASNTKLEKKEISRYFDKVVTNLPNDAVASKNIVKGSMIQKSFIKNKAIIEKNQDVDIVFQGRGVQIIIRGRALNEGAIGDRIMVRSDKYNKVYSAKIDSNSRVTVRI